MAGNQRAIEPLIVREHPFRSDILRCYRDNLSKIVTFGRVFANGNSTYNFELIGNRPVSVRDLTRNIYANQRHAFRINASCGFILWNNRTMTARYWYACWSNGGLFDNTPYVYNRSDWSDVVERLSSDDLMTVGTQPRANTEESVVWITNLRVWVWLNHAQILL